MVLPGPTDYNVKRIERNSYVATIEKAERNKKEENFKDVGPGSYSIKSFFEKSIPGVTLFSQEKCYRGKNEISPLRRSLEDNPGPGTYSP